ncbi:MAG: hypothetical protein EZS28_030476 [Streblomastix strix]|uniref:Uncharacterized protein n=1 Tax=Streblomastix strix TaxID=222440 RepID=A0A5J4UUD1_9EUKA|nr:MAG: hypothetical protein EZS28_030476 [Streblomastix strix]
MKPIEYEYDGMPYQVRPTMWNKGTRQHKAKCHFKTYQPIFLANCKKPKQCLVPALADTASIFFFLVVRRTRSLFFQFFARTIGAPFLEQIKTNCQFQRTKGREQGRVEPRHSTEQWGDQTH